MSDHLWLRLPGGQIVWAPLDYQLVWVEATRTPEFDAEQSSWLSALALHAALRGRGRLTRMRGPAGSGRGCAAPARGWHASVLGLGFPVLAEDRYDALHAAGAVDSHVWGPARRYLALPALGDRTPDEQHLHYPNTLNDPAAPHVGAAPTASA